MTVAEQRRALEVADGTEIQARIAAPIGSTPAAVVLLCHGFGTDAEECGAFPSLRTKALARGLAVVRFDFRAHGLSAGSNEEIRLATMRTDVEGVIGLIDELFGQSRPLIPIGLSFGAGPAVHAASIRQGALGVALWYPVVDYEWNFGRSSAVPFTAKLRAARSTTDPPWSEVPVPGTGMYFPTELVAEFPLDTTVATLRHLDIPVLVYHGKRDQLVDPAPVLRLANANQGIEVRMVPGAGHGFRIWRPWIIRRTISWCAELAHDAQR